MKLPKICSVEGIEKIVTDIRALEVDEEIHLDASDVTKVDISFLQMILAIEKQNLKLAISPQSEAFEEFLNLYHLNRYLNKD